MERASRVFCEHTLPMHYATLVCGRASPTGAIELCNAGHPPPLVIRSGEISKIDATGLPIGMFGTETFASRTLQLGSGEMLLLYTDGVIETQTRAGEEYGIDRLSLLAGASSPEPRAIVDALLRDLSSFRGRPGLSDDLTILAIRRL
jgi:serine phosphatase RsbU (regulator of sigma subunit)